MTDRVLQPAFIRFYWLAGVFCQPVQRACAKMTSRVGKHETSHTINGKAQCFVLGPCA